MGAVVKLSTMRKLSNSTDPAVLFVLRYPNVTDRPRVPSTEADATILELRLMMNTALIRLLVAVS